MSYLLMCTIGDSSLQVEYCWSSVDDCVKIVEMTVDGKFHRVNWMDAKGRDELYSLLTTHYMNQLHPYKD